MKRLFKVILVLTLTLILVLTVGLLAVMGQPGEGEVWISPLSPGMEYTIHSGEVGVIRWGWAAATSGLVQAFWRQANQEFVLTREDGWSLTISTEEARQHLTPIERAPGWDEVCFDHRAMVSRVMYYLWDLEPGDYTLRSRVWLDHRFTDGCDGVDQDGKPDKFEGVLFNTEVYIQVLE